MRTSTFGSLLIAILCSCGGSKSVESTNAPGDGVTNVAGIATGPIAMDAAEIEGDPNGPQYRMKPSREAVYTAPPGAFGKGTIRLGVQNAYLAVQSCYEKTLAIKPTLEGASTVTFVIGDSGKVTEAAATGLDADVDACVATAIKAAVFPAPTAATTVTYPLTFKRQTSM